MGSGLSSGSGCATWPSWASVSHLQKVEDELCHLQWPFQDSYSSHVISMSVKGAERIATEVSRFGNADQLCAGGSELALARLQLWSPW